VEAPKAKGTLGRPARRWENHAKTDLQQKRWEGFDWIQLAQNRWTWQSLV